MHHRCCSHSGQCNLLRRQHWIWQSCRRLGHLSGEQKDKPGSESCGLASSPQICALAPSGAPLSSERGRRRWACRSSPFHSSHRLPASTSDGTDKLRSTRQTCWPGPNIQLEMFYLLGIFVPLKADKAEASRLSTVVRHDADAHGISYTTTKSILTTCKHVSVQPASGGINTDSPYLLNISLSFSSSMSSPKFLT